MSSYDVYNKDRRIGIFEVDESGTKPRFSIILLPGEMFCGMIGTVDVTEIEDWIHERIIPPTRVRIENNLNGMGLADYDVMDILKFTKAKSARDNYWIDFGD